MLHFHSFPLQPFHIWFSFQNADKFVLSMITKWHIWCLVSLKHLSLPIFCLFLSFYNTDVSTISLNLLQAIRLIPSFVSFSTLSSLVMSIFPLNPQTLPCHFYSLTWLPCLCFYKWFPRTGIEDFTDTASFLHIGGLWQLSVKKVCWHHFSQSIFSPLVFTSTFGNSCNNLNFSIAVIFVMKICDQWSLM